VSEIDRIVDQLAREYDGDPWHGSPLGNILEGTTAQKAAKRPLAGGHTIWEIVLHMTAWKNEVRKRLSGAPASDPEAGDWPAVGDPTDKRWREALERLDEAHRRLIDAVRAFPESKLFDATNDTRDPALGTGVSFYELLHGVVQHDVYHSGQIALLKKAVG
jgi:uncharacterized damage-inducible protein DinB